MFFVLLAFFVLSLRKKTVSKKAVLIQNERMKAVAPPKKKYFAFFSPNGFECGCDYSKKECSMFNVGETLFVDGRCTKDKSFTSEIEKIGKRNMTLRDEEKTKFLIIRIGWIGLQINETLNCDLNRFVLVLENAKRMAEKYNMKIRAVYLFDESVWRLQTGGSVNALNEDRFVESVSCQIKIVKAVFNDVDILANFAGPMILKSQIFRDKVRNLVESVDLTHIGFDHYVDEGALSSWLGMKKFIKDWFAINDFVSNLSSERGLKMFVVPLAPLQALTKYVGSLALLNSKAAEVQLLAFQKILYNFSTQNKDIEYVLPWMVLLDKKTDLVAEKNSLCMKHMMTWKNAVETNDFSALDVCPVECGDSNEIFNVSFPVESGICNKWKTDASHLDLGCALEYDPENKTFRETKKSTCCKPI